ncbi:hypothetical protein K469DRAFT_731947 [Zopfia rhizophila CBS 207.26]|uniref:Uncharacterized protein n=1 Tax=Zopfia rhizophila CBS 207.26 TaxID=1314779 RepID=A0A6A6EI65_9PEZI|nr:hypothetical protein K469DRAFT_731947 [Zopfia rhizophila CBS 207.26]
MKLQEISGFIFYILIITATAISVWRSLSYPTDRTCSRDGDQDLYGLGVRLGIYIQLLTTTIVDDASPERATNLAPTNLWFLVAIFMAVQLKGLLSRSCNLTEAYIIISLGNGITFTILTGTLRLNPEGLRESNLTAMCRFLAWGIWKTTNLRFWWLALDESASCICPEVGWLFARVLLNGWFRTFHKVVSTAECVAWLVLFLPYAIGVLLVVRCVLGFHDIPKPKTQILLDLPFISVGEMHGIIFGRNNVGFLLLSRAVHRLGLEGFPFLPLINIYALFLTISTVEISIRINGIQGVSKIDSSGQLIALIIGLGSLTSALMQILFHK